MVSGGWLMVSAGITVGPAAGEEEKEDGKFRLSGQVVAAIIVAAAAGNILGARRFR